MLRRYPSQWLVLVGLRISTSRALGGHLRYVLGELLGTRNVIVAGVKVEISHFNNYRKAKLRLKV